MADKHDLRIRPHRGKSRADTPADILPAAPERSDASSQPASLPQERSKRRRATLRRVLSRLVIVLALALGGLLIWKNWDSLSLDNWAVWMEETLSGITAHGSFPVELSGGEVVAMRQTKSGLALLTDTASVLYSASGAEFSRRQHSFSKPILKTGGDYVLLADLDGTAYRLESRASILLNVTASNKQMDANGKEVSILDVPLTSRILSAAVGRTGQMAFVTDSTQSYTSELMVYDRKGKNLLRKCYATLLATDVAMSEDGRRLAVTGISADAGALRSTLLVYDLSRPQTEPVTYTDADVLYCGVGFFPGGTVAAVGDTALRVVNPDGELDARQDYADRELLSFAVGASGVSVVLRTPGSSAAGTLLYVTAAGDVAFSSPFASPFRALAPTEDGCLLLTGGQLFRADAQGLGSPVAVAQDGRLICAAGKNTVLLTLTALQTVR